MKGVAPSSGRAYVVRAVTLGLAFVHTFPAWRHIGAFLEHPSWTEGWKGFGAGLAIAMYLLAPAVQARFLYGLWAHRRVVLRFTGAVLVVVHAVPTFDHLPKFLAAPSWSEGWRGIGSLVAVLWFTLPVPMQAKALGSACRLVRWRPSIGARGSEPAPAVELA